MHLASPHVGCHGSPGFTATVRVNLVFAERKVVYIVSVGFTPSPPPFLCSDRGCLATMCDHFVCV